VPPLIEVAARAGPAPIASGRTHGSTSETSRSASREGIFILSVIPPIHCWEDIGVCGCRGSDQAQEDIRNAKTRAERAEIMMRPGPIGNTTNKRPMH